jgi:hypothetical protein
MELFVYFRPQKKLRVTLEKKHSLKVSKYKLWKTLHGLCFKYAKINGNKKALVERKDLVNKRIILNPVLHPVNKITNLCPLLKGIFRSSEGLGGVH